MATKTATKNSKDDEKKKTRYAVRRGAGHRPASMEFPEDLYEALQKRSDKEERSMAAITRAAVKKYLVEKGEWPASDVD